MLDSQEEESVSQRTYTAIIERRADTGLCVGHVPSFPGAQSQGKNLDQLRCNLAEVISMLTEDGEPEIEADFVGAQTFVLG